MSFWVWVDGIAFGAIKEERGDPTVLKGESVSKSADVEDLGPLDG